MWRSSVDVRLARMVSRLWADANRTTEATEVSLEPASPAVPAATEKKKHYEDDDEKCRGVHVASCACGCEREPLSNQLD